MTSAPEIEYFQTASASTGTIPVRIWQSESKSQTGPLAPRSAAGHIDIGRSHLGHKCDSIRGFHPAGIDSPRSANKPQNFEPRRGGNRTRSIMPPSDQ